ncbi:MAG: M48 family metalloprotease [Vicinamibacterales bacterium]|nr:M48 family metalloprotease [Vicinamibacterales bacterium]
MSHIHSAVVLVCLLAASAAVPPDAGADPVPGTSAPQLGGVLKRAQQFRELQVTEAEEVQLGEAVSEKVRNRYGVAQDKAVHRYVSLVGQVLVQKSSRPNLRFTFIVLDTDGVNAFAAPGGFVHITRGALGLMQNESELAGVLGHEIEHVTQKHTIKAMQKGKMVQMTADETLSNPAVFGKLVDKTTELVMAGFGRNEELASDRDGLSLANAAGYAPGGLGTFLTRLKDRNSKATEKQGLFASHPEMDERLSTLDKRIKEKNLAAPVVLADRYKSNIPFKPTAVTDVATVEAGSAGLAGGSSKKTAEPAEPKKKGFGLGGLLKPGGGDKKSAEVTGSGASRGVDTERNAKGGPVKTLVAVQLTPGDVEAFKKEGGLK